MKIIYLLSIIVICSSCLKDRWKPDSYGTKLSSINYQHGESSWKADFVYNDKGQIVEMTNFWFVGRRYEMEYEEGKLVHFHTYLVDGNELIFKDSLAYSKEGQLSKLYQYRIARDTSGTAVGLRLSNTKVYSYDNDGLLREMVTAGGDTSIWYIEEFFWRNGNIHRMKSYDRNRELRYEYFYEYDDMVNYKRNIPILLSDPLSWNRNNMTVLDYKDYYGNIDTECRPCFTEYQYNRDDYPIQIKESWKAVLDLKYE